MYKRIVHLFVLSCRRATFLIEKQLHGSLSRLERVQLGVHLSICRHCAAYREKAWLLDRIMSEQAAGCEDQKVFTGGEIVRLRERFKLAVNKKGK